MYTQCTHIPHLFLPSVYCLCLSQHMHTHTLSLSLSLSLSLTNSSASSQDTPVTAVQNFLRATTLNDDSLRSEESLSEDLQQQTPPSTPKPQLWKDIDQAEAQDHLHSAEYAPDIFVYMRQREVGGSHAPIRLLHCLSETTSQPYLYLFRSTYWNANRWEFRTTCTFRMLFVVSKFPS